MPGGNKLRKAAGAAMRATECLRPAGGGAGASRCARSLARIALPVAVLFAPALADAAVTVSAKCVADRLMPLFAEHRFAELETEFKQMLAQATERGDVAMRICARHFLGGAQGRLEKHGEAIDSLRAALADANANLPADDTQILDTRELLASALSRGGDPAAGIREYTELIPIFERRYGPYASHTGALLRNLANAQAWVGNHPETVRLDRRVLDIKRRQNGGAAAKAYARMNYPDIALAQLHLAESLTHTAEGGAEALQLAEQAMPEVASMLGPDHPELLHARLVLAMAKAATGDVAGALALDRETFELARLKLGESHQVTRKAQNNLAVRLSATGKRQDALELERKNLDALVLSHGPGHMETIRAYGNLSTSLIAGKRFAEAVETAEAGLRGMLAVRRTLEFDARIVSAWQGEMRDMVGSYLLALAATRRYTDAFLAGEFFKTRLLADRLALDATEMRLPGEDRKRYRAALLDLAGVEQELAVRRSLKQTAGDLEARRLRAADRLQTAAEVRAAPDAAELIPSKRAAPPWADMVRELSAEKTAYVSFMRIHSRLVAMSFAADGQILFAPLAPVTQLRTLIAATRHLMQPKRLLASARLKVWKDGGGAIRLAERGGANEEEISSPQVLLDELGDLLFKHLDRVVGGRQNIVFSTDDALAHAPLAALTYKGKPLVQSFGVSVVPSLETLMRVRARANQRQGMAQFSLLAFGGARYQRIEQVSPALYIQHEKPSMELMDLKSIRQAVAGDPKRLPLALAGLAIGLPNLPGSEAEAEMVARRFGGMDTGALALTGNQATEANWNALAARNDLSRYRTIHLAAHGFLSDDDPALSAIVLGQVRREPGTDGYLTAAELTAVDLNSDLFVVSACNSGVSGVVEGEGVQGLAHALFEAGTRHALLTLWPIDDKSTVSFMDQFYARYLAGNSPTAALAAAQGWAIDQGWPARDWAGFVLHGN